MRTLEVLGARRKLITTNAEVVHYDFYDPKNILVVDRENLKIPPDFLKSEFRPLPDFIYQKYSLKGFLIELLKL
jgi:hypothetical protein